LVDKARRTGTATPLGELFDHGCDSFSTIVVIMGVLTMLQVLDNRSCCHPLLSFVMLCDNSHTLAYFAWLTLGC
jgi:phosphatidylglycerophosphate synthase